MREPLLLDEPWDWLLGRSQPLSSGKALDGTGSPRLLTTIQDEKPRIALPTGQVTLPAASFPFFISGDRVQAFHLPADPRQHRERELFVAALTLGELTAEVQQTNCAIRPVPAKNSETGAATLSVSVSAWIDWQVWAFQELGHLPVEGNPFDAATRESCVRRSWDAAIKVWLREGRDVARMALVVELSRQQALHRALEAISRHPRRILHRVREELPLGRIQELDPVCIRDFARRSGVTAVEKAGPRQQLLAVRRREQRDTLENRITCWVLESSGELARNYCRANAAFVHDGKVREVRSFGRRARAWRNSESLEEVRALQHHPSTPNYPLQFEQRYREVWKTYLRIRREKMVLDDAWTWQRVLWGETGRQLLGCCLQQLFECPLLSTPFYRVECRQGCWTEPPVAPGPFKTKWGECLVFDSRDLDGASEARRHQWLKQPPFPGAQHVGASGCDQILLWPQSNRSLLVWHFYHAGLSKTDGGIRKLLDRCRGALEVLDADLLRFSLLRYRLSGLLLVADLSGGVAHRSEQGQPCVVLQPGGTLAAGGSVNALCLPPDADARERFVQNLLEGVQLVLEELHR